MPKQFELSDLDPVIHEPVRLATMALLMTGAEVDFTLLRDRLKLTDGNLAAHLKKLEEAGYVKAKKELFGRRPRTTYRLLPKGRAAFERHVTALERVVSSPATRDPHSRELASRDQLLRFRGLLPVRP